MLASYRVLSMGMLADHQFQADDDTLPRTIDATGVPVPPANATPVDLSPATGRTRPCCADEP
jgi:hypothetical protein